MSSIFLIIFTLNLITLGFCQMKNAEISVHHGLKHRKQEGLPVTNSNKHGLNSNHKTKELEKLKKDLLIDGFKTKLLKLLEVDEVPSASTMNINSNPIPEPILREYNRLLKLSNKEKQLKRRGGVGSESESRYLRQMMPDATGIGNDVHEYEMETARFNGSFVQRLTLLPKKLKDSDEDESCRGYFNDDVISNDNTKRINLADQGFTLLNCLHFSLAQNEFKIKDVKSADLYLKLDLNKIRDSFPDKFETRDNSIEYDLYIQINNKFVKRIKLIDRKAGDYSEAGLNENYANKTSFKSEDEDNNNNSDDSDDEIIYKTKNNNNEQINLLERIDIKDLLEEELVLKLDHSFELESLPLISVRLFTQTEFLNLIHSSKLDELNRYFSKLNENVALNVKFGDFLPNNSLKNRIKRRSSKKTPKIKNHRDCSDLRKVGYTSSNYTCCRETISFSIEQIGWSHWILSPKIIEYKYCRGGCFAGLSPRFDNTQIVYTMFELSHQIETSHCCNILDYEDDIPFIYGSPPNYLTKMVSLNAKNCMCS